MAVKVQSLMISQNIYEIDTLPRAARSFHFPLLRPSKSTQTRLTSNLTPGSICQNPFRNMYLAIGVINI